MKMAPMESIKERIMQVLVNRIKEELKKHGLTQKGVSLRLGQNAQWLNKKLGDRSKISVDDISKIACELNISVSQLFSANEENSRDFLSLPFRELIEFICREEIDKYMADICPVCNAKKNEQNDKKTRP